MPKKSIIILKHTYPENDFIFLYYSVIKLNYIHLIIFPEIPSILKEGIWLQNEYTSVAERADVYWRQ